MLGINLSVKPGLDFAAAFELLLIDRGLVTVLYHQGLIELQSGKLFGTFGEFRSFLKSSVFGGPTKDFHQI
jgi:hypothetical protein